MTEAETETETLERLELALRRIGELARQPKQPTGAQPGKEPEIDRKALLHSLDLLITRLRNGLELPHPKAVTDGVTE